MTLERKCKGLQFDTPYTTLIRAASVVVLLCRDLHDCIAFPFNLDNAVIITHARVANVALDTSWFYNPIQMTQPAAAGSELIKTTMRPSFIHLSFLQTDHVFGLMCYHFLASYLSI